MRIRVLNEDTDVNLRIPTNLIIGKTVVKLANTGGAGGAVRRAAADQEKARLLGAGGYPVRRRQHCSHYIMNQHNPLPAE